MEMNEKMNEKILLYCLECGAVFYDKDKGCAFCGKKDYKEMTLGQYSAMMDVRIDRIN